MSQLKSIFSCGKKVTVFFSVVRNFVDLKGDILYKMTLSWSGHTSPSPVLNADCYQTH